MKNIKEIIGKTEEEAEEIAKEEGMHLRLMRKDEKSFCVTCEFRPDRINIEVEKDKIADAYVG